jgi:hypothetical protein
LAARAFQAVPEDYATEQSVSRFCQGMLDKDAGQHVFLQEPGSVQKAMQMVRKYQQVHNAMYGKPKQRKRDNAEEAAPVYAVASAPPDVHPFMKALEELEQRLQKTLLESQKKGRRGRRRSTACYNCGEEGHIRRDCPKPKKDKKDLNGKGSDKMVPPRPKKD